MSISRKVIESHTTVQDQFFKKLDEMELKDSTLKQIKMEYVTIKASIMADVMKEVIAEREEKGV